MGDFGGCSRGCVYQALLDEHAAHAVTYENDGAPQRTRNLPVCTKLLDERLGHPLDSLGAIVRKEYRS
jgi:hypothetical protein